MVTLLPTAQELAPGPATTSHQRTDSAAEVTEDGTILLHNTEYGSPDLAAEADGAPDDDGWGYWSVELDDLITLAELRQGQNR